MRDAHLPAVGVLGVAVLPERGRAHIGHRHPSKSVMHCSAPASVSSAAVWAVVTPITRMPAARPAWTPTTESSKTRQRSGRTPSRSAAVTNTDRKSTRLNSSHGYISYAVFCLKKNKTYTAKRFRVFGACKHAICRGSFLALLASTRYVR